MATLTITLHEADFRLAEALAAQSGMSVEALLAREVTRLASIEAHPATRPRYEHARRAAPEAIQE